jgi:uncharacterized protein
MTVSLKTMIQRLPPDRQTKIKARAAQLIAEELARQDRCDTFHVFKDASGQWRWQLIAANGDVLASSEDGFKTKKACLTGIERVRSAAGAETVVVAAA